MFVVICLDVAMFTLEKMKSMTQKPVGPCPHVLVGSAQMVFSKDIVMMLAESVGTCHEGKWMAVAVYTVNSMSEGR
jgi:hypothetical protein